MKKEKNNAKEKIYIMILSVALLVSFILGLAFGSVNVGFKDILAALTGKDTVSNTAVIIRMVRLPRVIAGLLAGSGLAVAGIILQEVMNNSLASPNTIGVNSGAGFFVMLSMALFPHNLFLQPVMSFVGALLTSLLILVLAYVSDSSRITIVLAGITVSSFLSAGMNMMKILDTDLAINSVQFMVGSLSGVTLRSITYPSIGIVIGVITATLAGRVLSILSLGDGIARSLGLRVNLARFVMLIIASVLAGSVVSFAGLISFVGLIVPHICRRIFGYNEKVLIPVSAMFGGTLVMLCDLVGRVLFAPYELPAGILLSLIGGPFFLYLLLVKKGGRRLSA